MKEAIQHHPVWCGLVFLSFLISVRIILGLWLDPKHRETGVAKRLFWSFVVFWPFFGPMVYTGFYRVPKSHRDGGIGPSQGTFSGGGR